MARRLDPEPGIANLTMLALVALVASATVLAQSPAPAVAGPPVGALRMTVEVGFNDTFRLGRWTPVTVTVDNRGPDIVGDLEVIATAGNELRRDLSQITHTRPIELPRQSRKRLQFVVRIESFARDLVVRLTSAGGERRRVTVDLRHRYVDGPLVVVLSRDADLDYLNGRGVVGPRVLYPHPSTLPERWQGYDGVDAVVVHGVSLEALTAGQYEALERWLAAGGRLVVSGGPQFSLLRTPRLAALLPATPTGVDRLTTGVALATALGAAIAPALPFTVDRLGAVRGALRASVTGTPLIVESARGRGAVVYLTFDIGRQPFVRWSGMAVVWERVLALDSAPPIRTRRDRESDSSAVLALVAGRAGDFPGHGELLAFLAIYLGVLLAGYRRAGQEVGESGRLPWFAIVAPVVFAPAGFALFGPILFPAGPSAVTASVVSPIDGTAYADLELEVGFYSNRDQPLALEYERPHPVMSPAPPRRAGADWSFREGRIRSISAGDPRSYVLHRVEGRDVVPFDLRARTRAREGGGVEVQVTNRAVALEHAWLIVGDSLFALGPIPGDTTVTRAVDHGARSSRLRGSSWATVLGETAVTRLTPSARALDVLLVPRLGEPGRDGREDVGEGVLIALVADPVRLAGPSAQWSRHAIALVIARFALPAPGD